VSERTGIRDVAAAAGVSATTVSHVLNDVAGTRISPETRERVVRVAQQLGYAPNETARALRSKRSNAVGFVSDNVLTTHHASAMVLGAQEAASKHGLLLLMVSTGRDPDLERREIDLLLQRQVDGVIYAAMYHRIVQVPNELKGVPTVLLDARSPSARTASVVPDEVAGGFAAVQELIANGHRRIGFVNNADPIEAAVGRLEGYTRALAAGGLEYDASIVTAAAPDARGGYAAALQLLQSDPSLTALFCFSDIMAMGVYRAAAELGLRIPHDLSVIGFDNEELICEALFPTLTSMALPHYQLGVRAVDHLIVAMEHRDKPIAHPPQEALECPLVRRESVTSPPRR
jgi:LacI family transcriptional regulator